MGKRLVIIPTYNEIENIEDILREIFSLPIPFQVLVVDDSSPDGTGDKVRLLQEEFHGKLFLEVRHKKSGLGTAYIHGFKWALQREVDYIFEMDTDYSSNATDLPTI